MTDPSQLSEISFPALLRAARTTYGLAVRGALEETGFDDMPRQGSFVVGAILRSGAPLSDIIKQLGISKQAAGQLVDTLVARGYLDRSVDPEDRRRLTITLTERGREAAIIIRQAVNRVDAEVAKILPEETIGHARQTLAAIAGAASLFC